MNTPCKHEGKIDKWFEHNYENKKTKFVQECSLCKHRWIVWERWESYNTGVYIRGRGNI